VAEKAATVLALEVDSIQLAKNQALDTPDNIRFEYGGAENIPAMDASFDIVLMFRSLHHVPPQFMDDALSEIRRVLKPGGLAYISEPVYAGDFNEILRLFHDEETARAAAFAAEVKAVSMQALALVKQTFFLQPGEKGTVHVVPSARAYSLREAGFDANPYRLYLVPSSFWS